MTGTRWVAVVGGILALCVGGIRLIDATRSASPSSDVNVSASKRADLVDLGSKLNAGNKLTYTAAYKLPDGTAATVVQQPPNVAIDGPNGRFIFTHDAMYRCSAKTQPATCQKAKNTGDTVNSNIDRLIPDWIGQGFVTPTMASFVLLFTASLGSNYMVENHGTRTVAGLQSTCLGLTSLLPDRKFYLGLGALDLCVADNGVLTSFDGAGDNGHVGVQLTSYAETADPTAFQPPAGYLVTDVDSLTGSSASPSASPSASALK